jgi:hypothetical protein
VNGTNIAAYCNSIETERKVDSIDTTTFGQAGHTYLGGMTDGTIKIEGMYDDTAGGPKAIIEPLMVSGLLVTAVYRPEGTGSGRPQQSCNVLVTSYSESSAVADMIKWSSELQLSGGVTDSVQ